MTERTPTADASPIARLPFGQAATSHSIPAAKLEPLRVGRRRIVTRARLLESLSAAVDSRRLTLVAAPPGSGKTTLLSSWIEAGAAPARTVWLTLDEEDNAPERFWQGVLVALDPALAGSSPPLPSARLPGELTALLDRAIGNGDEPVVLVLDDFQEVTDERVLAGVAQLLKVAPPCFRMVIASRRDPALPLHRLRLAAQLAEVRAAPLAFTREEARLLLTGHGVMLSATDVDSLVARTEGWAGALALASLALRESDDPSRVMRDFGGDDRAVGDYLSNEVLAALPENLCDFLVRTAVVDEICGELADAHAGRAGRRRDAGRARAAQLLRDRARQPQALVSLPPPAARPVAQPPHGAAARRVRATARARRALARRQRPAGRGDPPRHLGPAVGIRGRPRR